MDEKDEIITALEKLEELIEQTRKYSEILSMIKEMLWKKRYNLLNERLPHPFHITIEPKNTVLKIPPIFTNLPSNMKPNAIGTRITSNEPIERISVEGDSDYLKIILSFMAGTLFETINISNASLYDILLLAYNREIIDIIIEKLKEKYAEAEKHLEKLKNIITLLEIALK